MHLPQELIDAILFASDEPSTIARCACVSHQWFAKATRILWRGTCSNSRAGERWATPGVGVLQRLARDPHRFRFYIGLVRYLSLYDRDEPNGRRAAIDTSLHDPDLWCTLRARYVDVDIGTRNMPESFILSLVNPSLLVLKLWGGEYSKSFLTSIQVSKTIKLWTIFVIEHGLNILVAEYMPLSRGPVGWIDVGGCRGRQHT